MSQEEYKNKLLANEMEVESPKRKGTPVADVDAVASLPTPAAEVKAKP